MCSSSHNPRVGFFLYQSDRIVIPHYRRRFESRADHLAPHFQDGISGEVAGARHPASQNDEELELTVAVMADVADDPFSPLPCYDFTYDVTDLLQLNRLDGALDAIASFHATARDDATAKLDTAATKDAAGLSIALLGVACDETCAPTRRLAAATFARNCLRKQWG